MSLVVNFTPGARVIHHGVLAEIISIQSAERVEIEYVEDGCSEVVHIRNLKTAESEDACSLTRRLAREPISSVSDKRRDESKRWMSVLPDIAAIPSGQRGSRVVAAAEKLGVSTKTIYRKLKKIKISGTHLAAARLPRSDKGKCKIPAKTERLIRAAIKKIYLTPERPMKETVVNRVQAKCRKRGWGVPARSTILRRIGRISPLVKAKARELRGASRGRYEQIRGKHPEVAHALQIWQMDHTPSDYCIVDSVDRRPIDGAQTLTLIIDVGTCCVPGFMLTIGAANKRVTGACLAFAFLPKEDFLESIDIDASWPCYGVPAILYTDGGSDFWSDSLSHALDKYGVEQRRRPKSAPQYGGMIESRFSKFLARIHELPGTRFSNLKDRMKYDPEGRAIMTLDEFRKWFTIFITKVYHQTSNSALEGLPPIRAWERSIVGHNDTPGIGLPDRFTDELKVKIDFLPEFFRAVHPDGIEIEKERFQSERLAHWVGAKNSAREDGKFEIKVDPYEPSEAYFLDPELNEYIEIPNTNGPPHLPLWESKLFRKEQRRRNRGEVNQDLIDEGEDEMRAVTRAATVTTSATRRRQEKTLDSQKYSVPQQRRGQPISPTSTIFRAQEMNEKVDAVDDGPLTPRSDVIPPGPAR